MAILWSHHAIFDRIGIRPGRMGSIIDDGVGIVPAPLPGIAPSFPCVAIRRSGWDRPLADLLRAAERISLRTKGFWGGGDL